MTVATLNRKPIFDTVRAILGRRFTQTEVDRIDRAIDLAVTNSTSEGGSARRRLGELSAHFESGGRGPGVVSSGCADPGGVSYGIYQLSSRKGTAATFMRSEGAPWADSFAGAPPGSSAFSAAWKAVAAREPEAFGDAQHRFIRRTHYDPAVEQVQRGTGLDLDARHDAVRDVTWSVAVQHGGAAGILTRAIERVDAAADRGDPGYDRALVEAIYDERSAYVLGVAARSNAAARRTLEAIARNRYPAELAAALAMLKGSAAA